MGLDNCFSGREHMPVLVELQGGVLRRLCKGVEWRLSHVLRSKMVMVVLVFDCVGRGDMAEGRGELMEIRGKHSCCVSVV